MENKSKLKIPKIFENSHPFKIPGTFHGKFPKFPETFRPFASLRRTIKTAHIAKKSSDWLTQASCLETSKQPVTYYYRVFAISMKVTEKIRKATQAERKYQRSLSGQMHFLLISRYCIKCYYQNFQLKNKQFNEKKKRITKIDFCLWMKLKNYRYKIKVNAMFISNRFMQFDTLKKYHCPFRRLCICCT